MVTITEIIIIIAIIIQDTIIIREIMVFGDLNHIIDLIIMIIIAQVYLVVLDSEARSILVL